MAGTDENHSPCSVLSAKSAYAIGREKYGRSGVHAHVFAMETKTVLPIMGALWNIGRKSTTLLRSTCKGS